MRKTLSLILAFCFVLTAFAFTLASCGGSDAEETKGVTGIETLEDGETAFDPALLDDDPHIEAVDYGGYEFTFLTREGNDYNTRYIVAEEGQEEAPLPSALIRRNNILEEKYNITITQFRTSDLLSTARAQIMSGSTDFDVILASCSTLATMAKENLLYNLRDVPRFDLSKPYWDQNANSELLIGDKLYFTNNALNIHALGFVVFFNKKIVSDYGLESPYDLIENNEWTVDKWAEMVKSVSKDMNGDGRMTEIDQYGTLTENHNPRMFLYAFGIRATTNNENGYPEPTLMADKDKTVTAYEKLKAVFSDANVCYNMTSSSVDPHGFPHKWDYLRSLFTQDLYMFHYTSDDCITQFADMESEFGVIPFPKYDSNQKDYLTMYQVNTNLFALPSVIEDVDRTGRIIEDMNFYSSTITLPTWFETLLTRRYTRDEESERYLRLLRDNCVYDIGLYYDFGSIRTSVLDVDITTANISRSYARVEKATKADIDKTYKSFELN